MVEQDADSAPRRFERLQAELVNAGAIVTERKNFPDRSLILGAPAKVVRQLTDEDLAGLEEASAVYTRKIATYRTHLVALD